MRTLIITVLACLLAIAMQAQRVSELCERAGTCWYDSQGYHKVSAVTPVSLPPGCPTHYDARACDGYKQALANAQEAYNFPATPQPPPVVNTAQAFWMHADQDGHLVIDEAQGDLTITSTKTPTRWQRFKHKVRSFVPHRKEKT